MPDYDVVICGCGPAGATAGLVLARQGRNVLMLDRAAFPRKKLCGGLLTWKSSRLLETVQGLSTARLTDEGLIDFTAHAYSILSNQNTLASGPLSAPFHLIDRAPFDARLLELAREAGAELRENAPVVSCDPVAGTVQLETGEIFSATYVIGADGANSLVRRAFSHVDRAAFQRDMAPAIEISLTPDQFPRAVTHPELHIGFLKAGYGWVFPNTDRVLVGVCGLRHHRENFSEIFTDYLRSLDVDPLHAAPYHGHPLPYGNWLDAPYHGRALLAGDAGGFVEPLLGEGIFYALCTGLYAAEAVDQALETGGDPGPAYARRIGEQILPELQASDRLRWWLFRAMRFLGSGSIGLFVNSAAPRLVEMVHGVRSYSLLKKKRWDFLEESRFSKD